MHKQTQIGILIREDIMGNMHYATMLGYYAQLLGQTKMLQQTSKVHEIIIGYGTFGSEVGIASRFGLATGIKAGGIGLDIPMTKVVIADNNNHQNFLNYRMQAGMIASSLEHQTPEQMYNTDPSKPVQGISTMKAFALANAEGQKLYTITQDNIAQVLPKIQASSLVKGDIQSAVNAGKSVTVHEREVSVPGWSGTGYMVIDNTNGDGAFLIGGGGNGGFVLLEGFQKILTLLGILLSNSSDVFKKLLRKLNNTIGTIINLIDRLIHCKKGLAQAIVMLTIVTLSTLFFVEIATTLLIFGSTYMAASEFIILTYLGGQIIGALDSSCGK